MYDRLYETEGKKIVFIGNSALAFGLRTDFIKDELPDYKIVNFGLYGAIGTKAMLDLSKDAISEGDIVIVAPERNDQAQSLFFSAENVWLSMDADFSMLFKLPRYQKNLCLTYKLLTKQFHKKSTTTIICFCFRRKP